MERYDAINRKKTSINKGATVFFALFLCGVLFTMGIIRGKCISKGYELSFMAQQIEDRRIELEKLEGTKLGYVNKEKLFPLASERGFIMMQEGKTFNVGR